MYLSPAFFFWSQNLHKKKKNKKIVMVYQTASALFPEELFCSWLRAGYAQFIVQMDWAIGP